MTELSRESRALIDQVSQLDDPNADDRARIKQRLMLQLGAGAFAAGAAASAGAGKGAALAAAKSGLFGTAAKVSLCAGALCVAGGALLLSWPLDKQPSRAPKSAVLAPAHSASPPLEAPAEAPPVPALEPLLAAPENVESAPAVLAPARARKAAPAQPAAVEAPESNTLDQELLLLQRAQAALRAGDGEQALRIAREHAARYPQGVLGEERMGIEALSECQLGQTDKSSAHAFLKRAPSSPLSARVRRACGLE